MPGLLVGAIAAQRQRWTLWCPVAVGTGVLMYFALPSEPPAWVGPLALLPSALLGMFARRSEAALALLVGLVCVAAGFGAAQLRTAQVAAPVIERRIGPVEITGRVVEVDERESDRRLVLTDLAVRRLPQARTPDRVRIRTGRGDAPPVAGSRVQLRGVLLPPPGPTEPHAFDFRRHAFYDGIGGSGYAMSAVRTVDGPPPSFWGSVSATLERARTEIAARVAASVPAHAAPVTAALLHGDQASIPEEMLEWFRASGLAHLLSISGLHIGLVAGGVFFVVRAVFALVPSIALRWPIKKIAAIAGLLAGLAYTLLVGAPVPTVRSLLMTAIVLLAILVDRTALTMRTVALAALAVLLVLPDTVAGASFQMSFGAVVALIAAYETFGPLMRRWRQGSGPITRAALYVGSVAFTSVIATLATAPFALFHFQQLAVYSVPANMIAVPVTALWVMPWAVIAMIAMPLGMEDWPLAAMGMGVHVIVETARLTTALPGSVLRVPALPDATLALAAASGLWLCLWRGPVRHLGIVGAIGAILVGMAAQRPDILVSGDGRPIAVRMADGSLSLSSLRAGRFEAESWRRRDGDDPNARGRGWPNHGRSRDGRLDCTPAVCLYRLEGVLVALVREASALQTACDRAQLVITEHDAPGCWAPVVIDAAALARDGAHAVTLSDGNWSVTTARAVTGRRPWSP